MKYADEVLADEAIVAIVYEGLAKRHPKSRCRGRRGAPADVVLRLLTLKHIRNWSYGELEREVRANLVYRDFTRVGAGKMPDAKTMGRWGVALGPQVIAQIHERMVAIARKRVWSRDARCVSTPQWWRLRAPGKLTAPISV
jgi:transposase, IS5 family